MATPKYAWHVHHEKLYEQLTDPLHVRIAFIKKSKPTREQTTRLRLIREVKDTAALAAADKEYEKLWKAYEDGLINAKPSYKKDEAQFSSYTARATKAFQDLKVVTKTITDLHAKECEPDCPWNGRTIAGGWGGR